MIEKDIKSIQHGATNFAGQRTADSFVGGVVFFCFLLVKTGTHVHGGPEFREPS